MAPTQLSDRGHRGSKHENAYLVVNVKTTTPTTTTRAHTTARTSAHNRTHARMQPHARTPACNCTQGRTHSLNASARERIQPQPHPPQFHGMMAATRASLKAPAQQHKNTKTIESMHAFHPPSRKDCARTSMQVLWCAAVFYKRTQPTSSSSSSSSSDAATQTSTERKQLFVGVSSLVVAIVEICARQGGNATPCSTVCTMCTVVRAFGQKYDPISLCQSH